MEHSRKSAVAGIEKRAVFIFHNSVLILFCLFSFMKKKKKVKVSDYGHIDYRDVLFWQLLLSVLCSFRFIWNILTICSNIQDLSPLPLYLSILFLTSVFIFAFTQISFDVFCCQYSITFCICHNSNIYVYISNLHLFLKTCQDTTF